MKENLLVELIKYFGKTLADKTSRRIDKIVDYFWK